VAPAAPGAGPGERAQPRSDGDGRPWDREGPAAGASYAYWLDCSEPGGRSVVTQALLFGVLIACSLAVIFNWPLKGRARGQLTESSIWFQLLRVDRPKRKAPWLHLHLKDGTEFLGNLAYYTTPRNRSKRTEKWHREALA
jgi:hypothetical protein